MLSLGYEPKFLSAVRKIKDQSTKKKVVKQIKKIVQDPEIGKPMRHTRKGTREVYIHPFRLSYAYKKEENKIIFLELYHKDKQ